jgi:hypothetical protein
VKHLRLKSEGRMIFVNFLAHENLTELVCVFCKKLRTLLGYFKVKFYSTREFTHGIKLRHAVNPTIVEEYKRRHYVNVNVCGMKLFLCAKCLTITFLGIRRRQFARKLFRRKSNTTWRICRCCERATKSTIGKQILKEQQ